MPPIVRDQARKLEAELRVVVAPIRLITGGQGHVRVFPGAPLPRRVLPDCGVGVEQQRGVGIDQWEVPQPLGDRSGKPVPLAREDRPHRG